jgi:rubrerythrin
VAKKEGYEQIAEVFIQTAEQEKEHAKLHLKNLEEIGDTRANLTAAAGGEGDEWTDMYPRMAREARAEGFEDLARIFEGIGRIEKEHQSRYQALLARLETGKAFERPQKVKWVCRNCGFTHEGLRAVDQCPVCKHPQSYFQVVAESF